jgi:hypothetical protein
MRQAQRLLEGAEMPAATRDDLVALARFIVTREA